MARVFLLDALGLAYRAHYAFINRQLTNSRGETISVLFAFANMVLKLRRERQPDYWALAWDGPGPTFRHLRYPEYKAHRPEIPPELLQQLPLVEELAGMLGLPVIEQEGVEADDVMGTLARRGEREGHEVTLVTSDKDLLQLVQDRVRVLKPTGRGEDYEAVDADAVRAKWGVGPEHIRDLLALMGDASDNIPGVPGVGEKTAVELMKQFGSLDALYEQLPELERELVGRQRELARRLSEARRGGQKGAAKLTQERHKLRARRRKLRNIRRSRELAFLSRELATVREDLALPYGWEDLRCAPIRRDALLAFARRHELRRLEAVALEQGTADAEAGPLPPARPAERRGTAAETPAPGVKLAAGRAPVAPPAPAPAALPAAGAGSQGDLDLWSVAGPGGVEGEAAGGPEEWEARLHDVRARAFHGLALLPVASGEAARTATLVGLALAARDGTACYLPLAHAAGPNFALSEVRGWLAAVLADPAVPKVGMDLKVLGHLLEGAGLPLAGLEFDLGLASFLCDPERQHSLEALAQDLLASALPPLEPAAPRGRPRPGPASYPPAATASAAGRQAAALYPLADLLRAQLEARALWQLYAQVEHPLIPVLLEMERTGVLLDRAVLQGMAGQAAGEIARLEEELYALAGERFNLNSGPQLAKVLFEKLGLKTGRRTKTGFSTDQATLEELAAAHAFPARLLEYRTLAKLKSTYLEALPQQVDPRDGRVHTTFHQAGAATGRLSSSDPNLQNIPMRTPQGRAIRRAFVAPPGGALVGADYSQIELRVMAHLSEDPNLIEAFRSGEDVHASTARRIFGVTASELDPALRARAKVVNFGVMYGMGPRSLSQQMGISLSQAQDFIAGYFRVYARVRDYLDGTLAEAHRRGWVQTLMGRRRYLPGLESGSGAERALAERAAINTPIQGSAADLMKLAMVRVQRGLKRCCPSARLLLQVHDELLLECPAGEAETVAERVRTEMEGCFPLRVPLVVSVGRGSSWFDVH